MSRFFFPSSFPGGEKIFFGKKRNNWKRFKPPGLLSFHFCFSEGYNKRSRETSAVMSVQTNGFRSIAQSRLCVAFEGLVLPQRAPTGVF